MYTQDPRYVEILEMFKKQNLTGHPRFYEILATMACVHADKNQDYSGSQPLANLRICANLGVHPIDGILTRISDKDSRFLNWWSTHRPLAIQKLIATNPLFSKSWGWITDTVKTLCGTPLKVTNESIIDTLQDRAVYTILLQILTEEEFTECPINLNELATIK